MTPLKAIIFGATGTVAEVADLERQAFNAAFKQAGLDWKWSAIAYKELLKTDGGEARIRAFRDAVPARRNALSSPRILPRPFASTPAKLPG